MDNLNKTQAIVDDIKKKLEAAKKTEDPHSLSVLERECVKAAQIAHMQFAYITRDIFTVVNKRRTELRMAAHQVAPATPKKPENVKNTPKKARENVKKRKAKKGDK